MKNDKDVDFNDKKLEDMKFIEVNYQPAVDSHLTTKTYVYNAIDEKSLVGNNQDKGFKNYNLSSICSVTPNNQAVNNTQLVTKSYVDQFQEIE